MDYYERKKELVILGELDESESYEVDYNDIGYDEKTGKFVWLTANGCSCWGGEYEEETYDTLFELLKALKPSEKQYCPTVKGTEKLMADALVKALELGLVRIEW